MAEGPKHMQNLLFTLISRVFVFVIVGAAVKKLLGKSGERTTRVFIWVALYVLIPFFVFLSMWANPVSVFDAWKVILAAVFVLAAGAALALVWAYVRHIPFSRNCLPIIFMNSAYLAIPVNTLLLGSEGTTYALIYNVVVTVFHFTLGVWWVNTGGSIAEIMGLPVIYAIVAGAGLNFLAVTPPKILLSANTLLTSVTLPIMLVFLGYRMAGIRPGGYGKAFAGVCLRMGGGLLAGWGAVHLFNISGPAASVCIISSSMPAAVNSYILSERFNGDAEFAAAVVFLGTIFSLVTLPLISYCLAAAK